MEGGLYMMLNHDKLPCRMHMVAAEMDIVWKQILRGSISSFKGRWSSVPWTSLPCECTPAN